MSHISPVLLANIPYGFQSLSRDVAPGDGGEGGGQQGHPPLRRRAAAELALSALGEGRRNDDAKRRRGRRWLDFTKRNGDFPWDFIDFKVG